MTVPESTNSEGPDERFVAEAWRTLELVYSASSVVSAKLSNTPIDNVYSVDYVTKQLDFVRESPRSYFQSATINLASGAKDVVVSNSEPADLSGVVASRNCQNEGSNNKVILRAVDANGAKKRFVEVWNGSWLAKSWEVTNKHGDFYTDASFGGLEWSPSGKYVVYSAEPKELEGFQPRGYTKVGNNDSDDSTRGLAGLANPKKYDFNEDFGESYTGKRPPVLIVVDTENETINQVGGELAENSGITPGQPTWVASDDSGERVVFIGYDTKARSMGMLYTENRPSSIYMCDINGNSLERLTDGFNSVRSPRTSPDKKSVAYLASFVGGPHSGSTRLVKVDIETKINTEIVPIVQKRSPKSTDLHPANFPGLYCLSLPKDPWMRSASISSRNPVIFCNSIWESSDAVLAVETETKKVHVLGFPSGTYGSLQYLSSCGNVVLASYSTPSKTPELVTAKLEITNDDSSTQIGVSEWTDLGVVSKDSEGSKLIQEGVEWSIVDYPERTEYLQTILTKPKQKPRVKSHFLEGELPPLTLFTHGGPHTTLTAVVHPICTVLTLLGFVVAQVNYTGSLGFGKESVDRLVCNIGNLEVDEMIYVAKDLAENKRIVDGNRMVYSGGSHSGYTGAHIAGRFPGVFRALVIRNPVINIAEMNAKSDIPDWCFAELGLKYDFNLGLKNPERVLLTPDAYKVMWDASPQQYTANVQDPVLINIGNCDRRVPPEQGYQYYRLLKANGKVAKCNVYPNADHPLDTVEAIRESLMSSISFFYEHAGLK